MLKSIFSGLVFSLVLVAGAVSLENNKASAETGSWYLADTIIVNGQSYVDGKLGDTPNYYLEGAPESCRSEIKDFSNDLSSATLITRTYNDITDSCNSSEESISLSNNVDGPNTLFTWIDADTVEYYDGGQYKVSSENNKIFVDQATESCRNTLEIGDSFNEGTFIVRTNLLGECTEVEELSVVVLNEDNNASNPGSGGDGTGAGGDATNEENSCEGSGIFMSWIVCGLIQAMEQTVEWADAAITGLLKIDLERFDSGGLEAAWARMRNISYILLIPVMLVMVIGTALNFNVFDAYTVKRALPRMFLAIVFIALSWDICRFMILVTNDIGSGIAGVVGGAVREGGVSELQLGDVFGGVEGGVTWAGFGLVGGIGAAAVITGAGGAILGYIFFTLLIVMLTLITAFLLLAFREVLIYALVIVAPLAIIAWIFPGNDKPWKIWWNAFSKLLMLFPIIMFMITIGKAFAWIIFVAERNPDGFVDYATRPFSGALDMTLKFIAYFAPYFLIPATFKLAGGAFANIAGMVNDKERGLFDRARKRRQESSAKIGKQTLYGAQTGMLGKSAARLSNANRLTWSDIKKGRSGISAGLNRAAGEAKPIAGKAIEEDHAIDVWANDDAKAGPATDILTSNLTGLTVQLRKKYINDFIARNNAKADTDTTKVSEQVAREQAEQMARQSSAMFTQRAKSIIDIKDKNKAFEKAYSVLNTDSNGNLDQNDVAKAVSEFASARTRHDDKALAKHLAVKAHAGGTYYDSGVDGNLAVRLATLGDDNAYGSTIAKSKKAALGAGRSDMEAGFGPGIKAGEDALNLDGNLEAYDEQALGFTQKAWEAKSLMTNFHESMKNGSTDNFIKYLQKEIDEAYSSGNQQRIKETTAKMGSVVGYAETYFKPQITKKLKANLHGMRVTYNGQSVTLGAVADQLRQTDPDYQRTVANLIAAEEARHAAEREPGTGAGGQNFGAPN